MYHNPIKQNSSFSAKSYPYKLMYVLLTTPFLSLTHAVTNLRYSLSFTNTTSATGKYVPYTRYVVIDIYVLFCLVAVVSRCFSPCDIP